MLHIRVLNGQEITPASDGIYYLPDDPIALHLAATQHDCVVRVVSGGRPHSHEKEMQHAGFFGRLVRVGESVVEPVLSDEASPFHKAPGRSGSIVVYAAPHNPRLVPTDATGVYDELLDTTKMTLQRLRYCFGEAPMA